MWTNQPLASVLSLSTHNARCMMFRMVDTVYRLIPQKDRRISVEMAKPNGSRRVIPDFVDEAEANAWIIQTKRLIRVAHPYPPGPKRKDAALGALCRRRPPT
jgi:hypothetical protein